MFRKTAGEHNVRIMRNEPQHPQLHPTDKAPSLAAELVEFSRALRGLFNSYRPERHYMRGRGPKWHAKHSAAAIERSNDDFVYGIQV